MIKSTSQLISNARLQGRICLDILYRWQLAGKVFNTLYSNRDMPKETTQEVSTCPYLWHRWKKIMMLVVPTTTLAVWHTTPRICPIHEKLFSFFIYKERTTLMVSRIFPLQLIVKIRTHSQVDTCPRDYYPLILSER